MTIFTKLAKYRQQDRKSPKTEFQTTDKIASAFYDYTFMQKFITFIKDSMTQTIEVPIYDDSYKECDEIFWLTPVSTSGYNGTKDITFKNADEGDSGIQSASVTISISQVLQDDLFVNMSDGNSYKIAAGSNGDTYNHDYKIKSKNTTQEPLNNICTPNIFTFINKQYIMTNCFKRVV